MDINELHRVSRDVFYANKSQIGGMVAFTNAGFGEGGSMTWRESNTILRSKLHPSEAPMSDLDKGYGIRSMPTTMAPDE